MFVRLEWHWRDYDDPTAPCFECSLKTGRRSKVDGHTGLVPNDLQKSDLETHGRDQATRDAARAQRRHDEQVIDAMNNGAPMRPVPMGDGRQAERSPLDLPSWWEPKFQEIREWWNYTEEGDKRRAQKALYRARAAASGKTAEYRKAAEGSRAAVEKKLAKAEADLEAKVALIADLKAQEAALRALDAARKGDISEQMARIGQIADLVRAQGVHCKAAVVLRGSIKRHRAALAAMQEGHGE